MFVINDDQSIYATRGDIVFFTVSADDNGTGYAFQPGDIVRMKVYGKKDAETVLMQKDFPVTAVTQEVEIYLTEQDTKMGEVISKPKDYWYEIELNPYNDPQTIIGYDEDGAKVFKLFPEGEDALDAPDIEPEDIPVVDAELDMTSLRPVANQAIARAITKLEAAVKDNKTANSDLAEQMQDSDTDIKQEVAVERARIDNMVAGGTADDAEVVDIRVGADGEVYASAGTAVREQVSKIKDIKEYLKNQPGYFYPKLSANRWDASKNTELCYVNHQTGELMENSAMQSSDFIDISDNDTGYITVYGVLASGAFYTTSFRSAFYDQAKNFISGVDLNGKTTDSSYAVIEVPEGAYYFRTSITNATVVKGYMLAYGSEMIDYVPYAETYYDLSATDWTGKTWLSYGDSITAIGNNLVEGWQNYVHKYFGFGKYYGRGIGGQTYTYNKKPWFANTDGSLNSRDDKGDMTDPTTFTVPDGTTAHYGYYASWDRIKTMIPDDIKNDIDLIFLFGVNDAYFKDFSIPAFVEGATLDEAWANAAANNLGGDYDITDLVGAVASTIMKLQARCPNALIVFGTGWSGRGNDADPAANVPNYNNVGKGIWRAGKAVKEMCNYFSVNCIDIWGTTGVNPLNRAAYNADIIHPYTEAGKKALARSVISGLKGIIPNIE